jgi:hypothetical protein
MARSNWSQFTSAKVAASTGSWKGMICLTAPAATALALPRPRIEFDSTSSSFATVRVRVVLGNTSQAGTARNPVATRTNNPGSSAGGTGLENLSNMGSGGTVIWEGELKGYGSFIIPVTQRETVVAPGQAIQIDFNSASAVNANGGWDDYEA